jgi:S-adenosyl-L-methionine hydrolase (adenosine-forming)
MEMIFDNPLIALISDFGWDDWYVGTMKGVIKGICRQAEIVDISHGVSAQSIQDGAMTLSAAQPFFPEGTIFLAIVDPGVGSTREPVIVRAENQWFLAPNNGILSFLLRRSQDVQCRKITNESYFLPNPSHTFHGRDIFAPCAAHLANGVEWTEIAGEPAELFGIPISTASYDEGLLEGNVVYFDHFGNGITNIAHALYRRCFTEDQKLEVLVAGKVIACISRTYADVPIGAPLAYWGSTQNLEIGINRGNARSQLDLKLLDKIIVRQAR